MSRLRSLLAVASFALLLSHPAAPAAGEDKPAPVDFNRDVKPILAKNCFACHGPDGAHRATKMRLDLRESATLKHKSSRAALAPGKPDESELVRRTSAKDEAERMPPK